MTFENSFYEASGYLDIVSDGNSNWGYLKSVDNLSTSLDIYVAFSQITLLGLRKGDFVSGLCRFPTDKDRNPSLHRATSVNGNSIDKLHERAFFDNLVPVFPDEQIVLSDKLKLLNLFCPVGKGSRGIIVAPPIVGKTRLLKDILDSIEIDKNVVILLVGERPEEVTDFRENYSKASLFVSSFDNSPRRMLDVAELAIEYCKRKVELGEDVILLIDSLTRLVRASNEIQPAGGRIMTGGLDSRSYLAPKKLFGAARNIKDGGSLTILASVLVDTGSAMDDFIYQELKSTANLNIVLDANLACEGLFPAVDLLKSHTRNNDLIFSNDYFKLNQYMKSLIRKVPTYEVLKLASEHKSVVDFVSCFKNFNTSD